jgi:hypothetical protein
MFHGKMYLNKINLFFLLLLLFSLNYKFQFVIKHVTININIRYVQKIAPGMHGRNMKYNYYITLKNWYY